MVAGWHADRLLQKIVVVIQPGSTLPPLVERAIPEATREGLRKLGHDVVETEMSLGGGQIIYIDNESGVLSAGSDHRKDGCAMGY